jgi:hypothetical protein
MLDHSFCLKEMLGAEDFCGVLYIRSHYQSLLNIYPVLLKSKQNHLEAINRQVFKTIHGWYDATNIKISHLPKYKTIDNLTQKHWTKIVHTIIRTNSSVLDDFLEYKMYLLYISEYYNNPTLLKEKRKIVSKGRTSKKIQNCSKLTNLRYSITHCVSKCIFVTISEFISIFHLIVPSYQNNIHHLFFFLLYTVLSFTSSLSMLLNNQLIVLSIHFFRVFLWLIFHMHMYNFNLV